MVSRETWLLAAVEGRRPLFLAQGQGADRPVRVGCGFPSSRALAKTGKHIGECWHHVCAADGASEIFISPLLNEPLRVLGVVAHELVHAYVGLEHGHKAPFKRVATGLGLEGKMTATTEGPRFIEATAALLAALGPYPQPAFEPGNHRGGGKKKDGIRQLK